MVETIDLTEIEVVDLATGYKAAVRVDAIPGETLSGTVVGISRVGVLARGDITYVATIELEDTADLPLRWGMSVIVDVETDQ
jgi:multidrug resistance efflux pump